MSGSGYLCSSMDISQAFVQAGELAVEDRAIGMPPESIVIADVDWEGAILCDSRPMETEEMIRPPDYLLGKGMTAILKNTNGCEKGMGPMIRRIDSVCSSREVYTDPATRLCAGGLS